MMENWKTILALTVLIIPLSFCEIANDKNKTALQIACIEKQGAWAHGTCKFD